MPAKINGIARLNKRLKKIIPDARNFFAIEMKNTIVDIITYKIKSGVSPVKGQNKYPNYSDAYAKKKGRKSPVDLTDSGDMLNDLRAVQKKNGNIVINFKSSLQNKKAKRHNDGLDGMPKRKMLPNKRGEKFKKQISDKIDKAAKLAVRKAANKFTK